MAADRRATGTPGDQQGLTEALGLLNDLAQQQAVPEDVRRAAELFVDSVADQRKPNRLMKSRLSPK